MPEDNNNPSSELSYDEIRQINIERNKKYLEQLFAPEENLESQNAKNIAQVLTSLPLHEFSIRELCQLKAKILDFTELFFPGRNRETHRICDYIVGQVSPCPALILHGPSGSGKTSLLLAVLDTFKFGYVHIQCSDFSNSSQVLKAVLEDTVGVSTITNDTQSELMRMPSCLLSKSVTLRSFIEELSNLCKNQKFFRLFLCFDNFEALESMDKDIASRIHQLGEIIGHDIRVIIVRRSLICCDFSDSYNIHFSSYTDQDILTIFNLRIGQMLNPETRQQIPKHDYVHIKKLFRYFRIDAELAQIISLNFDEFFQFVKELLPRLRLATSHPADLFRSALSAYKTKLEHSKNEQTASSSGASVENNIASPWAIDIPIKTRYVVIASYLASRNNKASDKFIFSNMTKGRRKKIRIGHEESALDTSLSLNTGMSHSPQSFTLERVLTIFNHIYTINGDKIESNSVSRISGIQDLSTPTQIEKSVEVNYLKNKMACGEEFFAMVNTLVSMKYLVHASTSREDQVIYYCLVDFAVVKIIARSVSFPIQHFLA